MKKWQKHERDTAKEFKGKRQRGSGNRWYNPLDIKTSEFLIENNSTTRKSFSITQKLWDKIYQTALRENRIGLLNIRFLNSNTDLIVMDKNDLTYSRD